MTTRSLQLPLQTTSLTLGFMVWVILSSLLPSIKESIPLTPGQATWTTAVPVLVGSVLRIPFGYWTGRIGARWMFAVSLLLCLAPIFWLNQADSFADLLVGGLFLGIGGAVFSVGVTSLPKYYPRERQGFVNGIYGTGNIGTAISSFGAPLVANQWGWRTAILLYGILLVLWTVLNLLLGDRKEARVHAPLIKQITGVAGDIKLWALCLFYFITFGSFVAFTVYLPNFLVSHFGLLKVDAGMRTAGFILVATIMRPVGGWLGDRFNPFKLLAVVFAGLTVAAVMLSFAPSIGLYTVGCLTVAFCAGLGNGTIFKLVPLYFAKQAGIANGVISAMGGLGGFFPPLLLTLLFSITGHYAIGFMALSMFALASLILVLWMFYQEKLILSRRIIDHTVEGIMVTDTAGVIQSVNRAFTALTGYTSAEAVGKTPSILKSGRQDAAFYGRMWERIRSEGHWQGNITNRRKNGELYDEWLTISSITNDAGEVVHYVGMFSDMSVKGPSPDR